MTPLKSPLPGAMAAMSDLEKKCLELAQALVNQGQAFKLSVTSGTFSLSLDTRGTTTKVMERPRKKLSPSQMRRNQRRKEEFLKRKAEPPKEAPKDVNVNDANPEMEQEEEDSVAKDHECNFCEKTFESENGLKIHKGKIHNKEILRSNSHSVSPLKASPGKDDPRECECCGEVMSPHHQCEESDDEEPPEPKFPCEYCEKEFKSRSGICGLIVHAWVAHKIDITTEENT